MIVTLQLVGRVQECVTKCRNSCDNQPAGSHLESSFIHAAFDSVDPDGEEQLFP